MNPARTAAGDQPTNRRRASQHPQALSPGARVSATLVATTGPHSQVTGLRTTPISVPEVFESRLAPKGTFTAPEKKTLAPWASAHAGHAMNHTSCAGSPQAQVRVEEGWPAHTCHHSTMAGTVKNAMRARWRTRPRTAPTAAGRAGTSAGAANWSKGSARWRGAGRDMAGERIEGARVRL